VPARFVERIRLRVLNPASLLVVIELILLVLIVLDMVLKPGL
jgi:hypothetical protein